MKKVISIGEALIDFIPHEKGMALKEVNNFLRVAGGAPLNVAAAVSKLGGKSQMLTKLGVDGFGDHILEEVKPLGVDVSKVLRTREANTALAFVSLKEDGERDFSFYRNPSADMLLNASEIEEEVFEEFYEEMKNVNFDVYGIVDSSNKIHTLGTDSKLIGRIFEMTPLLP